MFFKSLSQVSLIAVLAFCGADVAFGQPVTNLQVATVVQQFENAFIVPDVLSSFSPSGIVTLNYNASVGVLTVGQDVAQKDVAAQPIITISGTSSADSASGGPFNPSTTGTKFTFMLMDGNYPGSSNPNGYNLHFLQNDFTFGAINDDTITLATTEEARVPYAGPGPAAGSGSHRYMGLVFVQPENFTPPTTPAQSPGVQLFSYSDYVSAAGLTGPIAGTYFTVTNGQVTVSEEATTSVNPSTLAAATETGSSAAPTGSGSSSTKTGAATSRTDLHMACVVVMAGLIAVVAGLGL